MEAQHINTSASQHEFCHSGNIDAAVSYLSQELVLVGLPAVGGRGAPDPVALVNAAWRLLRSARDGLSQRQELQLRLARADADRQQLQASLSRSREQLSSLEARAAQQQQQQRQLTAQLSSQQARLNEARDETRRLQSVLQQRTAHFQHELKKQERQAEKLKDMTRRLLERERRGAGPERNALVISGLLGRADGSRARWRTPAAADKSREEAYERVLSGCEARHLRLVEETQRVRTLLVSLLRALTAASEQVPCEQQPCRLCSDTALLAGLELGLPYEQLGEQLDGLVACQLSKLTRLAQRTEERPSAEGAQSPSVEAQELRRRLEEAERTVLEQRLLIEATNGGDDCDDSFQRNAFFVEEREELAMRERMLDEQRQALARERDMYTEAVLRLGRERMAFESERAEQKQRQFLASSPLLSRRPGSARASPGLELRVEPPSPRVGLRLEPPSPRGGRRSPLLVTSPALRASADQPLSPADVTGLRLTSPARASTCLQRKSPAAVPPKSCLASPDPYLPDLRLPTSLYRSDPGDQEKTDRAVHQERPEP